VVAVVVVMVFGGGRSWLSLRPSSASRTGFKIKSLIHGINTASIMAGAQPQLMLLTNSSHYTSVPKDRNALSELGCHTNAGVCWLNLGTAILSA
jgi:hypothetical protein